MPVATNDSESREAALQKVRTSMFNTGYSALIKGSAKEGRSSLVEQVKNITCFSEIDYYKTDTLVTFFSYEDLEKFCAIRTMRFCGNVYSIEKLEGEPPSRSVLLFEFPSDVREVDARHAFSCRGALRAFIRSNVNGGKTWKAKLQFEDDVDAILLLEQGIFIKKHRYRGIELDGHADLLVPDPTKGLKETGSEGKNLFHIEDHEGTVWSFE